MTPGPDEQSQTGPGGLSAFTGQAPQPPQKPSLPSLRVGPDTGEAVRRRLAEIESARPGSLPIDDPLAHLFCHREPRTAADAEKSGQLRYQALQLALCIVDLCPSCPDRWAALRKLREAVLLVEDAIALRGFNWT